MNARSLNMKQEIKELLAMVYQIAGNKKDRLYWLEKGIAAIIAKQIKK